MAFDISGLNEISNSISAVGSIAAVLPNEAGYRAQITNNKGETTLDRNALLFHIEDENTLTLQSDITDHAVEDNTVVNDQIAIRPEIVTVRGFIGELTDVLPSNLNIARRAKEKLIAISGYAPELTVETLRALNLAEQAYYTKVNADKLKTSLLGSDSDQLVDGKPKNPVYATKQEEVAQRLYSYWQKKTLFTIITPWGKFSDMAINMAKVTQGGDTKSMSDFNITFKQIRFATTTFTSDKELFGRLANQSAKVANNGLRSGENTTKTIQGIAA